MVILFSTDTNISTLFRCNKHSCKFTFFHSELVTDINVIKIDWSKLTEWNYKVASTKNMEFAAKYISTALIQLGLKMGLSTHDQMCQFIFGLKFFGHSLGGHLAGWVAELLTKEYENCKASLVVAMDPAGYLFSPTKTERHCLTPAVAVKVIVLHTSLGKAVIPKGMQLGNDFMLGHEDYYFNGGILFPDSRRFSHQRIINIVLEALQKGLIINGYQSDPSKGKERHLTEDNDQPDITLNLRDELLKQTSDATVPYHEPFYVKVSVQKDASFGHLIAGGYTVPPHKKMTHGTANTKHGEKEVSHEKDSVHEETHDGSWVQIEYIENIDNKPVGFFGKIRGVFRRKPRTSQ